MKALLIPVDGPARVTDLPSGGGTRFINSLRALIGTGCAERIRVTTRWEAWLDENGTSAGRQVNQAATRLAQSFGWQLTLAGPVVIVGLDQDTDRPPCLRARSTPSWKRPGRQPRYIRPAATAVRRGQLADQPLEHPKPGSPESSHQPSAPPRNRPPPPRTVA
jgi:hypothetical protein